MDMREQSLVNGDEARVLAKQSPSPPSSDSPGEPRSKQEEEEHRMALRIKAIERKESYDIRDIIDWTQGVPASSPVSEPRFEEVWAGAGPVDLEENRELSLKFGNVAHES